MIFQRLIKTLTYPVLLLLASAAIFSVSIYGYSRLTDETLIAEITFDKRVNDTHVAHFVTAEQCQTTDYFPIYGDQWRVDARFLKWTSWASLIGLDAQYRFDRLEGRYDSIIEQNRGPHQAHNLAVENILDISNLNEYMGSSNFMLDTEFGSSIYQRIDEDIRYELYRSQSGLFVRSAVRERNLLGDNLFMTPIRKACAARPGYWTRFSEAVKGKLDELLN